MRQQLAANPKGKQLDFNSKPNANSNSKANAGCISFYSVFASLLDTYLLTLDLKTERVYVDHVLRW